jgi:hypothetical protein
MGDFVKRFGIEAAAVAAFGVLVMLVGQGVAAAAPGNRGAASSVFAAQARQVGLTPARAATLQREYDQAAPLAAPNCRRGYFCTWEERYYEGYEVDYYCCTDWQLMPFSHKVSDVPVVIALPFADRRSCCDSLPAAAAIHAPRSRGRVASHVRRNG